MPLSEDDLREYAAAWNAHDAERAAGSYFTDDATYEDVAMGLVNTGTEQIREFVQSMFRATPDIHFEVVSLFVAGDWLATEWVMTGTQTGERMLGPPATGKSFSIRGHRSPNWRETRSSATRTTGALRRCCSNWA
jgi:steroid delta-isomerase-like uncharacterized protein